MLLTFRFTLVLMVGTWGLASCRTGTTGPAASTSPSLLSAVEEIPLPALLPAPAPAEEDLDPDFQVVAEQFADIRMLRYQVPGFGALSLQQRKLLYYLTEAGLSGRDIIWDQHYNQNLRVRRTLEGILTHFTGYRSSADWFRFLEYAKRVFFANGIHHHASTNKIQPAFSAPYLLALIADSPDARWPLMEHETTAQFISTITAVICDPKVAPKRVNLAPGQDLLQTSAMNYYERVTQAEATAFYAARATPNVPHPVAQGLNSKLVRSPDGQLTERVWQANGMYDLAIKQVIFWLERALIEAEDAAQRAALVKLIAFYRTGELRTWDEYSILWAADTTSQTDAVNGFINVSGDPLGYRGAFESVVSFRDEVGTRTLQTISREAQWFEDHSPIDSAYRNPHVRSSAARVITVVNEAGDAAPVTPISIKLPNSPWVREQHGSKSVNLGNIVHAYYEAGHTGDVLEAFAADSAEVRRARQYGSLAATLYTDLREVIGRASGQQAPECDLSGEPLQAYTATIAEARADLVGLYYMLDERLIEMGTMPDLEVGRAQYDAYIRNALLVQLAHLGPQKMQLEERQMRSRQLVAAWAYQHGRRAGSDGRDVIERRTDRDGNTTFRITDYEKLRALLGQLLREMQRLTSEGDYESARFLVETYGVRVDRLLHQQVLRRYGQLNIPPYQGFIQPRLVPVFQAATLVDVRLEYPTDFLQQMLEYGRDYSLLPNAN